MITDYIHANAKKTTVNIGRITTVDIYSQTAYNDGIITDEVIINWFDSFITITKDGFTELITLSNGAASFDFIDGAPFRSLVKYVSHEGDPEKYNFKTQGYIWR